MIYFVTGASGFIGKRVVRTLLQRADALVYFLIRDPQAERVSRLRSFWGVDETRAIAVGGDITLPELGIDGETADRLCGRVDHIFHLAAVYDLDADGEADRLVNVEGTRNVIDFAARIDARRFHHVSSIAAAGLYDGVFREDMFDEADGLDHPYFATKHDSEGLVRTQCPMPWRIYRPGIVVGDSQTGEMDKIDGPYYAFKLIQKIRKALPPWMPMVGIEGGRMNLVPVDYVATAMVHLALTDGLDGRCFHLTDPAPLRVGEVLDVFMRAAHAPALSLRINAALFSLLPRGLVRGLGSLKPIHHMRDAILKDLGLPDSLIQFINYPTKFDSRDAQKILVPAGITVPRLEDYAWRLWDYWERHLDPDLFIDRSLKGRVQGKVVLVTGGSAGIGRAAALRIAEAGATTLIVGRDQDKLDATCREAALRGLTLIPFAADLAELDQCDELVARVGEIYGQVDILINNAGRSIRRGIEESYDRFHDFERTMRINYFGAIRLTMGLLPQMVSRRSGHVINISSIGVLTNAPRFSAYVASKAALESWTRCAASEFIDCGVEFTTVNMPLVRTDMIAPTGIYDHVPTLTPDQAAELIVEAIIERPERVATRLGVFGQVVHALAPRQAHIIMNTAYRIFPSSSSDKGGKGGDGKSSGGGYTDLAKAMKGLYF